MFKVMEGQAGNRVIISWKKKDSSLVGTSHFANIDDFLRLNDIEKLDFYQIKGKEKIILKKCHLCGNTHFDGTFGNCGN